MSRTSMWHCHVENSSKLWLFFIRNDKQMDFIDQLESVAYVLCGEKPVDLNTFNIIFHAKGVSNCFFFYIWIFIILMKLIYNFVCNFKWQVIDKLYRLIEQENSGYVLPIQIMEFIAAISSPR